MFLSQKHVTGAEWGTELIMKMKASEASATPCEYWLIRNNSLTKDEGKKRTQKEGRGRARKGKMTKLGNKEENPRIHDANEPKRGVKRDKWDTNGCRWDAEKHDIREGDAMGRQRHQRMNNAKFIPILHLVHLTSTHSARVQTALHQHEMRFLHFPQVT